MTEVVERYINEKTSVLREFKLNDENAVRAHLASKVNDALSDEFNIIRIDRVSREMIESYWDGDKTFCKPYARKEN